MKKILPIIIAVILAAFASIGIVRWAQSVSDQGQYASCMVAKRDLKVGTRLTQADLGSATVRIPSATRQGGQVWQFVFGELTRSEKAGTLENRVAIRDIPAGTPIMESMLRPISQEMARKDWKTSIPKGKRAIAIPVEKVASVSGLVDVGDHVDVLVNIGVPEEGKDKEQKTVIPVPMGNTVKEIEVPIRRSTAEKPVTFYLLQDVEVLAVGGATYREEAVEDVYEGLGASMKAGAGGSVTIALTPEQIQLIVFAISNGSSRFTLTLRTPGDSSQVDAAQVPPATFDSLLNAYGLKRPAQ